MKRILKYIGLTLLAIIAIPLCALLVLVIKYERIVWRSPALETPMQAQPLGAKTDLHIGTGGWTYMCAHNTPAAQVPFGAVRLGPDTESCVRNERCLNRSGYFYGDDRLLGFSHTRLVGADSREGGIFRVFPSVFPRHAEMRGKDRYTYLNHKNEKALPGYYAVYLPQEQVLAELTATPHVGVHRYTFDPGSQPHLLLDVSSSLNGRVSDSQVNLNLADYEITGQNRIYGSFSGRYGGLTVYFVARLSHLPLKSGTWIEGRYTQDATSAEGENIGVDLEYGFEHKQLEIRLAISYVSIDNARLNLDAESKGKTFEELAAAAGAAWEDRFNTIKVEGGTEREQTIFYTAMYRAFQMPTDFTDANGEFRGFDLEVHKAEGYTYYTDFSLWDTFRTVHPLYNLIARKEQADMMTSMLEMAKQGGSFPRWPSGCGYTNCMFGTPADVAVSEAHLKGIPFDIETSYAKLRETALTGKPHWTKFAGREGLENYLHYKYLPSDREGDAVSATLEYGWCDTALANLAKSLGKTEDAAIFAEHATWYRNLFNPASTYFEPRDSSGAFSTEIKPELLSYVDFERKYTKDYVEGSAEQWRFAVPYDPEGLVALFPSKEIFVQELEDFFEGSTSGVGEWNPGGNYWHGNEPYIHSAYLFIAAGRPDLTQKWVRWIMEHKYDDTYYGMDGNDDGGTLSSWYVLSAMGFYPIAGTTRYFIGSPLFDRAEMKIDDKVLTVIAENNSPENVYVKSVTLNGKPLEQMWFDHADIAQGGELKFVMGAGPH